MTNMVELDRMGKVEFHPYRSKMVFGATIDIPRDSTVGQQLEQALIKASGRENGDNHCCYTIHPDKDPNREDKDAPDLHIWVSDSNIRIGTYLKDDPIR